MGNASEVGMKVFGSNTSKAVAVPLFVLAMALALLGPWTHSVVAQVSGATLSGVVTDEQGGPVPDAAVKIKNLGTGVTREVRTNSDGLYSAPNLNPGSYDVTISAKGFQNVVQHSVTLNVGAQQSLNISLKVGSFNQTIEVTAAPPDVQTTTSTISSTVDSTTMRELPLNGRDWTSLATLEPGVSSIPNQVGTGFSANKGNRGFGNQLSNGGHRANENTYRVNGVSINDYSNGAPGGASGLNLGVDGIQEFSVLTSNYTAEYGRTSGAVINAISKSGVNEFHGTAFLFDRDKIFDAKNYFDPAGAIPPFRRVQFGGSGGTALRKDKTFVYGTYEGVRQNRPGSQTIHVPTDAERALAVPAVAPYLKLWPEAPAGTPVDSNGVTQTFNVALPSISNENYATGRVDQKFSDKDSLFGSYFYDSGPQSQPDPLLNAIHQVFSRRQMASVEETHIFNPTLANTLRVGLSRVRGDINDPVSGSSVAKDSTLAIAPGAVGPPQIGVPGVLTTAIGLGGLNRFLHRWTFAMAYDDAFLTRGHHSIKFGFAFERMLYNITEKLSPNGRLNNYPSLAALLHNAPDRLNALAPGGSNEVAIRESLFAGYIQDDWRFRPNLTINMGVRYEFTTLPKDANNRIQEITTIVNCATPGVAPGPTSPCGPQHVDSFIHSNPTTKNFEPRIGFSWDPFKDGKTAVRGGFGIFDVLPLPYVYTIGDSLTYPFSLSFSQQGLPAGSFPDVLPFINPTAPGTRYFDPHPHRSYSMNWNLNVQRQIASKVSAQVGYVGSHVLHNAFTTDDSNQVIPNFVNGVPIWPCDPGVTTQCVPFTSNPIANPNSAFIRPIFFDDTSSYNGLQSQLAVRDIHGFQAQAAYTWGKCLSDGDGAQLGDPYQNSLSSLIFFAKHGSRHGPCDFDIRQNLSLNYLYDLPGPHGDSALRWVAAGWQVGGIITASTGVPFTVITGGDPLGQNSSDQFDYPDRASGCNPINSNFKSTANLTYLNASCFGLALSTLSSGIRLGDNGRNQLYGPKLVDVDFSVIKNTHVPRISESFAVQLRFEFFNLFNHTNFQAPLDNNTLGGSLGQIDATTTTSRQIQLGAKVIW